MLGRNPSQYKIKDPAEQIVKPDLTLTKPPGVYLREVILPDYGMTNMSDLARRLGVDRAGLHGVLTGKYDVSRDLAYKLGALLHDKVADFMIAYQHAWDLQSERAKREAYKATIERVAAPVA